MNNVNSVRLYFAFALFLLFVGWKLTQNVSERVQEASAKRAAQIERVLSSME